MDRNDGAPDVACSATLDRGGRTPGPWRVEWPIGSALFIEGPTIAGAEGQWIAEILSADVGEEPSEMFGTNDARLIAAAPELLDALIEYFRIADDGDASGSIDVIAAWEDAARAAIAKATGEAAA